MPRLLRVIAPAVLLAAAVAAVLWGLALGGAAAPRVLQDPGEVVRYGLPLMRTLVNISIAALIGSTVMAVWALAAQGSEQREYRVAMDLAATAAGVLTVAAATALVLTFASVAPSAFANPAQLGPQIVQFATEIELGQLWLWEVGIAAVTTVLAFAIRGRRLTLVVLVAALATALPLAQQGHAAGASGHSQAVNSLLVHLIGAAVWLGGLVTLVFLAKAVSRERLAMLVSRYSSLALLAFIGVAASGVVSAWLRIGSWDALLGSGYGQLVLLKTGSLLVLGVFGAIQRRRLIPRIAREGREGNEESKGNEGRKGNQRSEGSHGRAGRAFAWFVVAELAVMGVASGIAGALGRTATPVAIESLSEQTGSTPAEILTGDPLPPPLTVMSYFTEWRFDLAWALVCAFGIGFYLAGVIRLARRGDRWPAGRALAWVTGMLLLFYTTNGPLNAYEQYLFSVHMLGHMMLTMLIPLILVLGAPITLALRAIAKRDDGSWGAREWIMWGVQTPFSKVVTHPVIAAAIFVGSLWVFYFTPVFRWSMTEHLGHQWMIIHFLISGYLFCLSMIGVDPVPRRFPYPLRLVVLFATMAAHAFFGVTIMSGDSLLLSDWFGAMGRTWGATPLQDQSDGGGIAWGIGELPTLALALIVAMQWSRSDTKEQKRRDRAADRSGDAELAAYNEMLAKTASRDAAQERGE